MSALTVLPKDDSKVKISVNEMYRALGTLSSVCGYEVVTKESSAHRDQKTPLIPHP